MLDVEMLAQRKIGRYTEAKSEARESCEEGKNIEEWAQLGRDLEKDAFRNQWKFRKRLRRVRERKGMLHTNGKDGQRLTEGTF